MIDDHDILANGHDFPALKGIEAVSLHTLGRRSEWLLGRQTTLARNVAIKRLRAELAGSFDMRDAFIRAGRQAAAIVHPSALSIINIYPDHDAIVTEWCSAAPVRELSGQLAGLPVAAMGVMVLDGLAALHATGRCHGNLTPGNVFRDADGTVRVNDYFQPPVMPGERPTKVEEWFIPPEVMDGAEPDWRSDLFSLGRILEFACGSRGAQGEAADVIADFVRLDPASRSATPADAHQRLLRAKNIEERRDGFVSTELRRKRRQYRRVPAELSVSVKKRSATPVETGSILSKVKDIGENGVFVAAEKPMPIGSIVELHLTIPDNGGKVHAFGLVRWISQPPMAGMGVQFVEIDAEGIAALRHYLSDRDDERNGYSKE